MSSRGQSGTGTRTRANAPASPVSKALTRALDTAERSIVNRRTERAYVFAQDGTELLSRSGTKNQVVFANHEASQWAGAILTHNHPSGTSFSPEDITFLAQHRLAEIRAVTTSTRYSMKPPASGWPQESPHVWGAFLQQAVSAARRSAKSYFDRETAAGRMTVAQANQQYWDRVWTNVAFNTGLQYTKTSW